jgi:predicted secreted protein
VAELTLTEADDGGRFALRVGDAVTLRLTENAAGGYRWSVVTLDASRVELEGQRYEASAAAVGSVGTAVWRLRAKQAGVTRLELRKARPWEPAEAASARFAVTLEIE